MNDSARDQLISPIEALKLVKKNVRPLPAERVELVNRTDRTQFIRVKTSHRADGVLHCEPSGAQGSDMLGSFAAADSLAQLPPGPVTVEAGKSVNVYSLGWS